ncbi:MAG: DUF2807 domain-containing protein [Bacteroidales bacterium]|nr:DUF2807 domain-containing protein [Bacteroidales bacterium]
MKKNIKLIIGLFIFTLTLSGCYDFFYIEGNGDIVTQTLDLKPITGLEIQGLEGVDISWGEEQEVVVTGDANIIEMISMEVNDSTWFLHLKRGNYRNYDLKYYITLPRINMIANEGLSRITVNDFVNTGDLEIYLEGAGSVELNRMENTENLFIDINGLGQIKGFGEFPSLEYLDIIITGSGRYLGYPIQSIDCHVDIEGTGKCEVYAEETLNVNIEGAGLVNYKGFPKVYQHINGLGSVANMN